MKNNPEPILADFPTLRAAVEAYRDASFLLYSGLTAKAYAEVYAARKWAKNAVIFHCCILPEPGHMHTGPVLISKLDAAAKRHAGITSRKAGK